MTRRSAQIMRAAAVLFRDAGYRNVSIDEIGAAVGLTGPAVYRHFAGKHDILVRTLIGQVELVEDMACRAADGPGTPERRMAGLLADLEQHSVHRDEAMLWRRERRHLRPAEREQFRAAFGKVLGHTRSALAAARPELGESELELLSVALLSLFGNTPEMRLGLDDARLAAVQGALARAIVGCAPPGGTGVAKPSPAERTPAGRRERIIAAAAELFDRRGFHDVRVDDIARAAGMSGATLYQQFPNKTLILLAILERGAEGLLYVTAEALARADDVLDTLVGTYVDQALGLHGRTMRILATDAIYLPEQTQRDLRAAQREYVAEWTAAVRARHPDHPATEARAVALAVIGVVTDLSQTGRVRAHPDIDTELRVLAHAMLTPAAAECETGAMTEPTGRR
ncbi:TetR/AcrR family transcriptional regulator [Nocardia asteroides]|uniref:TetR/AcrR family transcriptional regulator n=1 Tax=Nocardia asteroides TaxID=1824 RepID=UPI001E367E21|nr:TetR/AcrR family transcriptional regulator [Nocardia asteroides]UGT62480.1 TetR/AcrR family transcriptional regulator [Nocardia asteroides]